MDNVKAFNAYWNGVSGIYEVWAKRHNMALDSMNVLYAIADGIDTQKKICAVCCIPKQTVCGILKHYTLSGDLEALANEDDGRSKIYRFTESGECGIKKDIESLKESERQVFAAMGIKDASELKRLQEKMMTLLKEELEKV